MIREELLKTLEEIADIVESDQHKTALFNVGMMIDGKKHKAEWIDKKWHCPICKIELNPSFQKECPACGIRIEYKKSGKLKEAS